MCEDGWILDDGGKCKQKETIAASSKLFTILIVSGSVVLIVVLLVVFIGILCVMKFVRFGGDTDRKSMREFLVRVL